jgi:hypothetical protein
MVQASKIRYNKTLDSLEQGYRKRAAQKGINLPKDIEILPPRAIDTPATNILSTSPTKTPELSPKDQQALYWANSNPNDSRSL